MAKAPHLEQVLRYARDIVDDKGIEELQRLGCRRFLDDLESGRWDFRPALPEFCLELMTGLFCFAQGERMDGTPLRGKPLELMPWHVYCTYALAGFWMPGTQILRFTEGDVFAPRKTVKTTWAEGYQACLALWFRKSGAKAKTVAGSLKQGLEGFDWLVYNFERLGLVKKNNPPGVPLRLLDSSLGHSIEGDIWGGHIDLETLAFKPELFDSFNASFVHLDELELYRNATPYTRLRDGMKAYTNKQILCTFTAGDDGTSFAAEHRNYMERILRGTITGPAADRTFVFLAQAPILPDGSVDFLNPAVHRAANPAYNITIRPSDMIAAAEQAEHNPILRKEFFTRSLNIFVSSMKAWFDVEEFRRSDQRFSWTQTELARLVRHWYGGADLSKLHDLTAAAIVGEVPRKTAAAWIDRWREERKARRAASSASQRSAPSPQGEGIKKAAEDVGHGDEEAEEAWTPPEDVLVVIPHAWFPIVTAAEKADKDQIPLFGWKDDGWLDMPNTASMDPTEPVRQFLDWKAQGFGIREVGHDRKFARPYFTAMRKAGFRIKDQPQLYIQKSEGFRYLEHKAKVGCLYYLHAEPFEYCVQNVSAAEKVDDAVQYQKIGPNARIDIFDAAVFAVIRLLIATDRSATGSGWWDEEEKK